MKNIILSIKIIGLMLLMVFTSGIIPMLFGMFSVGIARHIMILYGLPLWLTIVFSFVLAIGFGLVWGHWSEKNIRPKLLSIADSLLDQIP